MSPNPSNRIYLRELAPREGFQILPHVVPTAKKLELIAALAAAKVDEIEVTSFVRPDRVPQLADCEQLVTALGPAPSGVRYRALCLNGKGYSRSLQYPNLEHPAWFYTGASDTFLKKNANTSFAQQLAGLETEWGALWRATGESTGATGVRVMISNAFGCSYEGIISAQRVVERWSALRDHVATLNFTVLEVSIADTVGLGTAESTGELIALLRSAGAPELSLHLHDTHGRALECLEVGLRNGVRIIESSVAGMGGCPFTRGAAGNVATEAVVRRCEELGYECGVNETALMAAARLATQLANNAS